MPHITIEHSSNVKLTRAAEEVLKDLHEILAAQPSVDMTAIKSRIITHNVYRVSDGAGANNFVHLRLDVLTGRDIALRQQMGEVLLKILVAAFEPITHGDKINYSLEVREMERETYFKQVV